MTRVLAVLLLAGLAGCATFYEPAPSGYSGPKAVVADAGVAESIWKVQLFVVQEIDGKTVDSSIFATLRGNPGLGFSLGPRIIVRSVPARPMKVKLIGTHLTPAPIQELAGRAAGTFFSVDGVVDFTPVDGARYVVNGELTKEGSSVWIEDDATREIVTQKVRSRP